MNGFVGGWTQVTPGPDHWHEFERVIEGHVFRAYRHRTDYGWSWWTVTKDGKDYWNGGDLFASCRMFV